MSDVADVSTSLADAAIGAKRWVLAEAAPLWAERGRTRSGLFAERISLAGEPDYSYFRTFVQARHIFSFVTIGRLGWTGGWKQLVTETVATLLAKGRREDGLFVHRLNADAHPIDSRTDLYDQAFVLLAFATAGEALGNKQLFDEAQALLDRLEALWGHPNGGFREGEIVDPRVRRQNPHMHLLEAFLLLSQFSQRDRFRLAAIRMAELARDKFVDPASGALTEYFADDLSPAPQLRGRIVEPGHCFEWAWLFEQSVKTGVPGALTLSDRLTSFARGYGQAAEGILTVNQVLVDGTMVDSDARLWPQTERLKAAAARYRRTKSEHEAREAVAAMSAIQPFIDTPTSGLWRDKLRVNGSWIDEPAPGSSLYHLTCAIAELVHAAEGGTPNAHTL